MPEGYTEEPFRPIFSLMRKRLNPDSTLVPRLAAAMTALVGLVNIASSLTPDIRWRGHLLLQFEPIQAMRVFHALALPGGALLLLTAPYLLKRRRRAMLTAIPLMVLLGFVNLFKGLDVEETIVTWLTAGLIYRGRVGFTVVQEPITLRSAVWRVPLIGALGVALVTIADWVSHGGAKLGKVLGESGALLVDHKGSLGFEKHSASAFHHVIHFAWIPLGVHFVEIGTLLAIAYVIFRPLAAPRSLPDAGARRLAVEVIQAHGRDTLSFFKLRRDQHYFFSEDRSAFVSYRVEAGVLLVAGDPVGPPEQFPGLLVQLRAFARVRGLKLAAVGASESLLAIYEGLGLRNMYLGDECLLDIDAFSLEGRKIRKVRQSVHRLTKAGFTAELLPFSAVDNATFAQIERVIELGRLGAPERGFSMAMDSVRGTCEQDTTFVLARDAGNEVRGVLHFVPCYGRSAVSLSFMRRDPSTPNGLTEFLVTEAVARLREQGVAQMSLNFATFARFIHSPENRIEKLVGWTASKLDKHFQIESLYRFNAKFFPEWSPRYIVFEGWGAAPRTALAAAWAEGQIPKPRLPRFGPRNAPQDSPLPAAG